MAGVVENAAKIKSDSIRAKIAGAGDLLKRNQELVTLRDDLVSGDWESPGKLRLKPPDLEKLRSVAASFELRTLAAEFETVFAKRFAPSQGTLF